MAPLAFDLAERFQTPVFVVSDLDIGMNDWMIPRLRWDDSYKPDRGKVLTAEELEKVQKFGRYQDTGGGIPARTLPGTGGKSAYFTRGSGHTAMATYTEDSAEYQEVLDRLALKMRTAANAVPAPEIIKTKGAEIGIVTVGGCRGAVLEAIATLKQNGISADFMRIRGFPFSDEVAAFIRGYQRLYVVEQNRDAQLRSLLALETGVARDDMIPVLDYAGLPLTAKVVVEAVAGVLAGVDQ
jgi:2-oxoglutarate ferredoxin oxidoreductase subunit alpha